VIGCHGFPLEGSLFGWQIWAVVILKSNGFFASSFSESELHGIWGAPGAKRIACFREGLGQGHSQSMLMVVDTIIAC